MYRSSRACFGRHGGSKAQFFTLTLTCGGETATATIPASDADWPPAFIGHRVFVPRSFGPATFTFTDPQGDEFTEIEAAFEQNTRKGGSHPEMTCTYLIEATSEEGTFPGGGSVTGFVVGKR